MMYYSEEMEDELSCLNGSFEGGAEEGSEGADFAALLKGEPSGESAADLAEWSNAELRGLMDALKETPEPEALGKLSERVAVFGKAGPAGGVAYVPKTPAQTAALLGELRRLNAAAGEPEAAAPASVQEEPAKGRKRLGGRGEVFRGQGNLEAWKALSAAVLLEVGQREDHSRFLLDALEGLGGELAKDGEAGPKVKRSVRGKPQTVDWAGLAVYLASFVREGTAAAPKALEAALLQEALDEVWAALDSPPLNIAMREGERGLRLMAQTLADEDAPLLFSQEAEEDGAEASLALNPLCLPRRLLHPPALLDQPLPLLQ